MMDESVKMKRFDHPNVISLIGVCVDAGIAPYLIMPFMANGSLLSYLKRNREDLLLPDTTDEDIVSCIRNREDLLLPDTTDEDIVSCMFLGCWGGGGGREWDICKLY